MKKNMMAFAAALVVLLIAGCTKAGTVDIPKAAVPEEPPVQQAPQEPAPADPEVGSLLNGLPLDEGVKYRRPLAVMLDNQANARPQAGLSEADLVIEALVEGEITRYMAVFQSADPQIIGPVRSARPYFINKALEYDAYYIHAGGSPQALSDIVRKGVADLDSLHQGRATFWRKSHKKAPHNLYTSPEALRKAAASRKYRTEWHGLPQTFSYDSVPSGGTPFAQMALHFKEPGKSDAVGYIPRFTVSKTDQRLMRSVNGQPHLDETTQKPLYAENLIIQIADHRLLDRAGRLEVDLIGKGTGFYCRAGEYWPITWEKTSPQEPTVYQLNGGAPLVMKPGKVWIEIFPPKKLVEFK